jgi:1-acyl-sn-glycerol-3-phosphate acyltransferase
VVSAAGALVVSALVVTAVALYPIPRHRRVLARLGAQWCSQLVLRALGVGIRVEGHASTAQGLLVANHLSWIDILAAISVWHCTFVAKREVRSWPIVGRFADALGVLWIDRSRRRDLLRVIPALEHALRDGETVLLFPEGTTSDGSGVLPFRSGLFEAARRAEAPVIPITLIPHADQQHAALCWHGTETLVANLPRVAALSRATVTLTVHATIGSRANRKLLARTARGIIADRFERAPRVTVAPLSVAPHTVGTARERLAFGESWTRYPSALDT